LQSLQPAQQQRLQLLRITAGMLTEKQLVDAGAKSVARSAIREIQVAQQIPQNLVVCSIRRRRKKIRLFL